MARGAAGSSSQDPSSKRGGRNLNLEQETGFWQRARLYVRLPRLLFLYSFGDGIIHYFEDEFAPIMDKRSKKSTSLL